MAGPRQPINLVVANGKKHLSKAEIEERRRSEVQPCTDDIAAPSYLTAKQKKQFATIAGQLQKLNIMGETDCDALARYITAQSLYEDAVKNMRQLQKERPKLEASTDRTDFYSQMEVWSVLTDNAARKQDRYFKQAQTAAAALGLTISSRCKLAVPVSEEKPKANKFTKFSGGRAAGSA